MIDAVDCVIVAYPHIVSLTRSQATYGHRIDVGRKGAVALRERGRCTIDECTAGRLCGVNDCERCLILRHRVDIDIQRRHTRQVHSDLNLRHIQAVTAVIVGHQRSHNRDVTSTAGIAVEVLGEIVYGIANQRVARNWRIGAEVAWVVEHADFYNLHILVIIACIVVLSCIRDGKVGNAVGKERQH